MTATLPSERAPQDAAAPAADDTWPRRVLWLAAVAALPLFLWWGRDHWFFADEWLVLDRPWLSDPGWFDAHNGHWVTVVHADYRLLFRMVGLQSYWPYQVPVVLAHIGSAVLLRVLLRRLAVRPWLATAVAVLFLFFGSGRFNITYGFQISMTGSLLAGLALLLIADREGPVTRADGWGLLVGVVGLMTSGAFPPLLVGVGVAILIRRGWRVAAFYAAPLALVYAAWYVPFGRGEGAPLTPGLEAARFTARMLGAVFTALTAGGVSSLALGGVAVVGLVATARTAWRTGDRHALSLLAGVLTAWLVFACTTALARASIAFTAASHDSSRYVHIGAALALPAVAVGVEHLARWRALAGALAALLLVTGVPRNVDQLVTTEEPFTSGGDLFGEDDNGAILAAMAGSDLLGGVSGDTELPTRLPLGLTAAWLSDLAESGRLPRPDGVPPEIALTADGLLALQPAAPGRGLECPSPAPGQPVTVDVGDEIQWDGVVTIVVTDGRNESRQIEKGPRPGALKVQAGPLDVVVEGDPADPPAVCSPLP